jgi:hypothetical protein
MFNLRFLYGVNAEKLVAKKAASLTQTLKWSRYSKLTRV